MIAEFLCECIYIDITDFNFTKVNLLAYYIYFLLITYYIIALKYIEIPSSIIFDFLNFECFENLLILYKYCY